MIGWKLFNQRHGQPLTLYHGINGSRSVATDTWIQATERPVYNPGKKGGTQFVSGFHYFNTRDEAVRYKDRFAPNNRRLLLLAQVEVDGCRQKPNSPAMLAAYMRLDRQWWEKAERIST